MITEKELLLAIEQCERAPVTYDGCQKLAALYTLLDRLYGGEPRYSEGRSTRTADVIYNNGGSEFLDVVNGKPSLQVWAVLDELLEVIRITNPRLYNGVIRRLEE